MKSFVVLLLLVSIPVAASVSEKYIDEKVGVVVPCKKHGIGLGDAITSVNSCIKKLDKKDVPDGFVSPRDFNLIDGKTVKRLIVGGEAIKLSDVVEYAMKPEIDRLSELVEKLKHCYERCDTLYQSELENIAK